MGGTRCCSARAARTGEVSNPIETHLNPVNLNGPLLKTYWNPQASAAALAEELPAGGLLKKPL